MENKCTEKYEWNNYGDMLDTPIENKKHNQKETVDKQNIPLQSKSGS